MLIRHIRGQNVAGHSPRFLRRITEVERRAVDFASCFRQRLTLFADDDPCKPFTVFKDKLRQTTQHCASFDRRERLPVRLGGFRRLKGALRILN